MHYLDARSIFCMIEQCVLLSDTLLILRFQMSSEERFPFPFKLIPLENDVQKKIAKDFGGNPNGLVSCNHWGFKLSATVTAKELEELYNHPLDPRDVWVVTPPKCGTTWTQEMVWLLAHDLDYEGAKTPLMPCQSGMPFELRLVLIIYFCRSEDTHKQRQNIGGPAKAGHR